MKVSSIAHVIGILVFFLAGVMFTFFSKTVRAYYFRMYKEGVEQTGFPESFINKYPGDIVFRVFGIVALAVTVLLVILLVKKVQA